MQKEENEEEKVNTYLEEKDLKRKAEDKGFLVQDWYETIKNFTSETVFLDLSHEEADAIVAYYKQRFCNRKELNQAIVQKLRALENKISNILPDSFTKIGFFVRLSYRSPKDGQPLNNKSLMELYTHELEAIKKKVDPSRWNLQLTEEELETNLKFIAMFRASEKLLKCTSAKNAMSLILTSERVLRDCNLVLACAKAEKRRGLEDNWNMKVILRKWEPKMIGTMEFRCFVKDNKLTAISQYNHYIIIEELLDEDFCLEIRRKLFEFWRDNIRKLLDHLKDYVIDLALLTDNTVTVIELNPFEKTTGPSLFDWEADKEILFGAGMDTNAPTAENIHFRKRREPYPNITGMFNDFYILEMKRMSEESPYWELLDQFDPPPQPTKCDNGICSIF